MQVVNLHINCNCSYGYTDIEGPAEATYENGVFRMKLLLSHRFPQSPTKGYFLTMMQPMVKFV